MEKAKKTLPWIPVGHAAYVWRSAADVDVQRTWRRYGWTPPSEKMTPPIIEDKTPAWAVRRVK